METALGELGGVLLARKLEYYPEEVDLMRVLRVLAPQAVFLNVELLGEALAVARAIEKHAPGLPVVAFHKACDPAVLLEVMRAGVREFLYLPFHAPTLRETMLRIEQIAARIPPAADSTNLVFAFLPSKAGVGTSTLALNASIAMSEARDSRILLADFDLNNGMIGFMLKLDSPYSVEHAAENALKLDEKLWSQLVSSAGRLDVLPSGKMNPGFRIDPAQVRGLLDFARRHYKAISVDLSGNMEKYSIEVLHEAKRIFLVCTQELPSLHLARQKLSHLKSLDLEDRVSIVLNRTQKRAVVGVAGVEQLLGASVEFAFPNDYAGVHKALTGGKPVDPSSELGKRFRDMADSTLSKKTRRDNGRKRFVEYFAILPGRYSLFPPEKSGGS